VRLDLLITGETHAHATAAIGGTHLVSAGATAPLKRGVEPSVELLQVGYGTVVPERITLGDARE
jgi:predicted phosphodiesterase